MLATCSPTDNGGRQLVLAEADLQTLAMQAEEMHGTHRQGMSAEGLGGAASVAGWTGRLAMVPDGNNSSVSSLPEFQAWLRQILFELLLFSVQVEA